MTTLITGGSGFVGLNIAAALLERGEPVVLLDINEPPPTAEHYLRSLPGTLVVEKGDAGTTVRMRRRQDA